MFKKGMLITISALLISFSLFSVAKAVDPLQKVCDANPSADACQSSTSASGNPIFGPKGIITKITEIIGWVVGVVAVIAIIVNGLRFVLSNGSPESVASARSGLIYAVIGILVAVFAQAIALFVLRQL